MWRTLVKAGVGFATLDVGLRIQRLKRSIAFYAVAGVLAFFAVAALLVALGFVLAPHLGAAGAAGAIGGALLVLAGVFALVAGSKPRRAAPPPVIAQVSSGLRAARDTVSDTLSSAAPSRGLPAGAPSRSRSLNVVLLAALAGVILGRRL
ncbi:phage holin family protein [Methylopila musalis]|uniref:Phage holin family protein n=1 Tax=Methylopila musalis TaxID=1134781 RepID=A0ABW3Z4C4_9HYPH